MIGLRARFSSRLLMYLIVGLEMLVLSAIVASQELNRALDAGPGVDLEIGNARARKDPFRGGYVSGPGLLDLNGSKVMLQAEPLERGDKVLVFFAVAPGRRPSITGVQRGARGAPPFTPTDFSIPGTVRGTAQDRSLDLKGTGLVARIGSPEIIVQLDLPSSIPVDDAAVEPLSAPSLLRARLRRGFFEHRYLDDVRLIGRGWTPMASFAYDDARGRLIMLAPRDIVYRRTMLTEEKPQSDVFVFDALGKEQGSTAISGRLVDAVVEPSSGHLLALVSEQQWGHSEVSLIRIREDGRVTERSPLIAYDRVLGFDATGGLWVLVGLAGTRTGPYFIERMTFAGPQGPRLGPFVSQPGRVVTHEGHAWVVEHTHHRITRVELPSGRTMLEYRELNGPSDIAVDAGAVFVIEANRTQLTKLAADGHVVWRLPRFQGLAWVVAEPGTGGCLIGAPTFDGRPAGVLRVGSDGAVARVAPDIKIYNRADWRRGLSPDALRSTRDGRLYLLGNDVLEILGADGALLRRIEGFRFPTEQRVRS